MTHSKGSIAFVEDAAEARAALSLPEKPLLVALSPEADHYLQEQGASHKIQEDFYDERELKPIRETLLRSQYEWAREVEAWIREKVPAWNDGFSPLQAHYRYFKVYFDALQLRAWVLSKIFDALNPETVWSGPVRDPESFGDDFLIRESLVARLAPQWAKLYGAKHRVLEGCPPLRIEAAPVPWSVRVRRIPGKLRRILKGLAGGESAGTRAILLEPGYDLAELSSGLSQAGFTALQWQPWLKRALQDRPPSPDDGLTVWKSLRGELETQPLFRRPVSCGNADLFKLAQARFERWWDRIVPQARATFCAARAALEKNPVHAIALPLTTGYQDVAAVQAANQAGIPTFNFQHGGFNGTCNYTGWEVIDFVDFSDVAAYGESVRRHYQARRESYTGMDVRLHVTGSPRLERFRREHRHEPPGHGRVFYFTDMYKAYTRYLCGEALPDVPYYRLQRSLVDLFARYPDYEYVLRPFRGEYPNPIPEYFLGRCRTARVSGPEHSLLEEALRSDLVVADMPSTGMTECLLAPVPMIVLSDESVLELNPEASAPLKRRVRLATDPKDFLEAVEASLKTGRWSQADENDQSYLAAFAPYEGSARRAVELLTKHA